MLHERLNDVVKALKQASIPRVREALESPVITILERKGFIEVESRQTAIEYRLKALEAFWAITGQDYLINRPHGRQLPNLDPGKENEMILELRQATTSGRLDQITVPQVREVVARTLSFSGGKKKFQENLNLIFGRETSAEDHAEARRKIVNLFRISLSESKKDVGHKAIILAQPADSLRGTKVSPHYGFEKWIQFGIDIGGTAIPYGGASVVYAELLMTGRFSGIEIVDFDDSEAIKNLIRNKDQYDLVMISGANSGDTPLSIELNRKLANEGLKVLNGGAVASINSPDWYIENGGSVFIGECEGTGEKIVEWLDGGGDPTVIIRGDSGTYKDVHSGSSVPITVLTDIPPVANMEESYAPEREKSGYLAHRLIALEMSRPIVSFAGRNYEPPPLFQPHPSHLSYGCPNNCTYCTTAETQGHRMRHRPASSIEMEWKAIRSPIIGILDQNFTANGKRFVVATLEMARDRAKKVAFQSEAAFFNAGKGKDTYFSGTKEDAYLEKLLTESVIGIEVGLEMPVQVAGTTPNHKKPETFAPALEHLNKLGVIVFATAVIGMPTQLWSNTEGAGIDPRKIIPYSDLSPGEWKVMVDTWVNWLNKLVPVAAPIPMVFTPVYGTPAYNILLEQGLLLAGQDQLGRYNFGATLGTDAVRGIEGMRAVSQIREALYSHDSVLQRLYGTNLPTHKFVFMYLLNRLANTAFKQRME